MSLPDAKRQSSLQEGLWKTSPRILRNRARCRRCNQVIESRSQHDFVTCNCGAISVDGGTAYLRRCADDLNDVIEMSEYEEV